MNLDSAGVALIEAARAARLHAHAPFSRFLVGAALLGTDGRVFTGCNVENATYGLTVCAERVAVFKAVSEGHRDIEAIAVVGKSEDFTKPCGACRQVMVEFDPKMKVLRRGIDGFSADTTASELLPERFDLPVSSRR